jgi:shikimate kinase
MPKGDGEIVIRGPVLIPAGWLVAIIGAAVTGIGLAFGVGVWVATVSSETKANSEEIADLKRDDMPARMVRVETILTYAFPKQAERAIAEENDRKQKR